MSLDYLKDLLDRGFEVEFEWNSSRYSITFGFKNGDEVISFCEYYQEPVDVKTFDELLNIEYKGERLSDIWASLTENDIWV